MLGLREGLNQATALIDLLGAGRLRCKLTLLHLLLLPLGLQTIITFSDKSWGLHSSHHQYRLVSSTEKASSSSTRSHLPTTTEAPGMGRVSADHDSKPCGSSPLSTTPTTTWNLSLRLLLDTSLYLATITATKNKWHAVLLLRLADLLLSSFSRSKPYYFGFVVILNLRKPACLRNLVAACYFRLLDLLFGLSSSFHNSIHPRLRSRSPRGFCLLLTKHIEVRKSK